MVVGASMVCLASNIFRSVCALPRSEDACFPPQTACFPRSASRPTRPHSTRVRRPYGQVGESVTLAASPSPQRPTAYGCPGRVTTNAGLRSLCPVRLRCPARGHTGGFAPQYGQEPESTLPVTAAHTSPPSSSTKLLAGSAGTNRELTQLPDVAYQFIGFPQIHALVGVGRDVGQMMVRIDRHGDRHRGEQILVGGRVSVGNAVRPCHSELLTQPVRDQDLGGGAEHSGRIHRLGEGDGRKAGPVCGMSSPTGEPFHEEGR